MYSPNGSDEINPGETAFNTWSDAGPSVNMGSLIRLPPSSIRSYFVVKHLMTQNGMPSDGKLVLARDGDDPNLGVEEDRLRN